MALTKEMAKIRDIHFMSEKKKLHAFKRDFKKVETLFKTETSISKKSVIITANVFEERVLKDIMRITNEYGLLFFITKNRVYVFMKGDMKWKNG